MPRKVIDFARDIHLYATNSAIQTQPSEGADSRFCSNTYNHLQEEKEKKSFSNFIPISSFSNV